MTKLSIVFIIMISWWLFAAGMFPVLQDEAYYMMWSKYLSFGYFDHPPFVAWAASMYGIWKTAFFGRLGIVVMATITMIVSANFFRKIFFHDHQLSFISLILLMFSFAGLIVGFLLTPDTPMLLFWILVMHEVYAAYVDECNADSKDHSQRGCRWGSVRWLTGGLCFGLGLLSKYMMVLMAVVIFLTLLLRYRKAFLRPTFYLGIGLAALTFSPNVFWNATHDWTTFKFQMKHGLSLDRNSISVAQDLPRPDLIEDVGGYWETLSFVALDTNMPKMDMDKDGKPIQKKEASDIEKSVERFFGFIGAQMAFWGCFLLFTFYFLTKKDMRQRLTTPQERRFGWWLCFYSSVVPLLFFGIISIFSKVEANWGVMYMFGAAPLLAPLFLNKRKAIMCAAMINFLIMMLLLASLYIPVGILAKLGDRLLRESSGFKGLSGLLDDYLRRDELVFADTYQTVSMLSFYSEEKSRGLKFNTNLGINQWPGITRPSELAVNKRFAFISKEELLKKGTFVLLTSEDRPQHFADFEREEFFQVRDCVGHGVEVVNVKALNFEGKSICKEKIHKWYVTRYKVIKKKNLL